MAKSKEELIYDIENNLVDSNTNKITGDRVKARLLDMVDAMGQGGGGGQMEYWSFPNGLSEDMSTVLLYSSLVKVSQGGAVVVWPTVVANTMGIDPSNCIGLVIDHNLSLFTPEVGKTTIGEVFDLEGINLADAGGVRVTEEEFYTI